MNSAKKSLQKESIAPQAAKKFNTRAVPADWYLDPVDSQMALGESEPLYIEDQTVAFLSAQEREENKNLAEISTKKLNISKTESMNNPQSQWIGTVYSTVEDSSELSWQVDALCAQTDPEAFFPEKGGSTRDAKKVCSACNVKTQCLEYALTNDERFGIWGGLSERERRRLRKRFA